MQLAPGYENYLAFLATSGLEETNVPITVEDAGILSDDEDDEDGHQSNSPPQSPPNRKNMPTSSTWKMPQTQTEFDLNQHDGKGKEIPIVEDDEDEQYCKPVSNEAEFLNLHRSLGHISFAKMQEMAKQGTIPSKFAKCKVPACAACLYSKATKKGWRSKPEKGHKPKVITTPGRVISVDQMVSPAPGFVAQIVGILTRKRYKYATVYVDQASRLGYVYLQKTSTANETLKGKLAFELYAQERGVRIQSYHADNGIFKDHKWVESCHKNGQGLTFAGVNAHYTNGLCEKRIRDLQDQTRTMITYAKSKWKNCITVNLWPYALLIANDVLNNAPNFSLKDKRTPMQYFTNSTISINKKHYHPFGCPAFVLDKQLQSNKPFNKWNVRSKVGIYLGQSPHHGKNVALILDRRTGLVSPQHHYKVDPTFSVTQQDTFDSHWMQKAGLISQRENTLSDETRRLISGKRHSGQVETPSQKRVRFSSDISDNPKKVTQPPGLSDIQTTGSIPEGPKKSQAQDMLQQIEDTSSPNHTGKSPPPVDEASKDKLPPKTADKAPVPRQPLLQAMIAEISESTKEEIKGELLCL